MDEQFEAFGSPQDGVIEEAAELIKAICKAERFGYRNYHPKKPSVCNAREVLNEIDDLEIRIHHFKPLLIAMAKQFEEASNESTSRAAG